MDPRRLVIAPALVIALGAVGAALLGTRGRAPTAPPPRPPPTAPAPARPARDAAPSARAVLPASLAALTARLDARYALRPDARFALALHHLAALAAPGAPAPELRASRDGWTVLLAGSPVATLPPEVTFDAMLTAAVGFATERDLVTQLHLTSEGRPPADGLDARAMRDPWGAARAADARWVGGSRRAADVAAVGRALALSVALGRDPLGLGDAVAARALAALALARAAEAPDPAAEALLAHAMTYATEARSRADALGPAQRALGAWVRDDAVELRRLAANGDAAARLLAGAREADGPARYDLAGARRAAQDIPARVLSALERDEGAMSAPGAAAFARFAALEASPAPPGGWIDSAVVEARRRARWGDGLMGVLAAARSAAATPAQAQEVLGLLGDPSDPLGDAWLSWAQQYVVAAASASARASLAQDAGRTAAIGVPTAARSLRALVAEGLGGTASLTSAIERLAHQMDQRPAHQLALGALLLDGALDVPRAEALLAAGTARGAGVDAAASAALAARRGDRSVLLAIGRGGGEASGRAAALRALARAAGPDGAAQDAAWAALTEATGDDAAVAVEHARALVDRREAPAAGALLERWLSGHAGAPPAARVAAAAALGELLLGQRDLAGAWRVLEPWASSDAVAALSVGARVLMAQERLEEAERLARRAWDRDEHAPTTALLAEACWRRANHAAAAEALNPRAQAMGDAAWEESVGAAFDAVFSGRAVPEGRAALDALGPEVTVARRSALLTVMARAGHGATAAEMHEHLRGASDEEQRALWLARYAMRARTEGELPAGEWLQTQVPAVERVALADGAYALGLDEVLWGVLEVPPGGAAGDRVWLLRAAASLRRGGDDPHRPELMEHLRAHDDGTWAQTLARHLMDLATYEAVRASAETPRQEWQTAYYVGLKARAGGDAGAASEWWQAALDPAEEAAPEARWALAALREGARGGGVTARREAAE